MVRGIRHHVYFPILAAGGLVAEPQDAVGQPETVLGPIRLAPPAPVDWVGRHAWTGVALL